jgi:hypothetical protein
MKNTLMISLLLLVSFVSCKKDEETTVTPPPVVINNDLPSGAFTKGLSGSFVKQNGYNAAGTAELGQDAQKANWVHLAPNFDASLSTGAVTLYISKTQQLNLGNAAGFVKIANVTKAGEHYYKTSALSADFKFAILWCSSANVQFGNAELK